MKLNKLTDQAFHETFKPPMVDITDAADQLVEIWPYLEIVFKEEYSNFDTDKYDVEYVYKDNDNKYQHVLININEPDIHLVVVVDIEEKSILGHFLLNLQQKYGINN